MNRPPFRYLPATCLLALCEVALAQAPVAISSDVSDVVSGGQWSSGSPSGIYRVVVRTGGWEHVVSQAQIDWIADPTERDQLPPVVKSVVVPTGSWRLDAPRIVRNASGWRAELTALETHFTPPVRGKWIVRLGGPGEAKSMLIRR